MVTRTFGDVEACADDDRVAAVQIRRPPDNFFDAALIASLADACDWLAGEAGARSIVLCSQGKHFCAGADFTGRSSSAGRIGASGGAKELYNEAARLFEVRVPVVAAVQGARDGVLFATLSSRERPHERPAGPRRVADSAMAPSQHGRRTSTAARPGQRWRRRARWR